MLPAWTYRRIASVDGDPNSIVMLTNGTAHRGGKHLTEYMLCSDCEQRIGIWENYVGGAALQKDDTFPGLEATTPLIGSRNDATSIVDGSALNKDAVCRFAASVIWRASKSQKFHRVKLGKYEDEIAAYLLNDAAPLPAFASLILTMFPIRGGLMTDHCVTAPYSWRRGTIHVHLFAMCGLSFRLAIGGVLPATFEHLCYWRTSIAILSDGKEITDGALALMAETNAPADAQTLKPYRGERGHTRK